MAGLDLGALEIEEMAQLVGVLYPIEGATLGGQVIGRALHTGLGMTANCGARFFSAYGEKTGLFWTQYLTFAERVCQTPQACETAVQSAVRVFQQIEDLLNYGLLASNDQLNKKVYAIETL